MSESIPEYILKNPITAEVRQRRDTENDEYSYWHIPVGDKYKVDLPKEVFNELFVPLDRQALTEQLNKIIWFPEDSKVRTTDEVVEQVLALFGLENTGETK